MVSTQAVSSDDGVSSGRPIAEIAVSTQAVSSDDSIVCPGAVIEALKFQRKRWLMVSEFVNTRFHRHGVLCWFV